MFKEDILKIAIIDDGITELCSLEIKAEKYICIDRSGCVIDDDREVYIMTHASICGAIIRKYASSAEIISIKVLDEKSRSGNIDKLCKGIEWCIENDIKLINLSLGSTYWRDFEKLSNVCNKAFNKSIIIVAAKNNNDVYTFPAGLATVLGVKSIQTFFLNKFNIRDTNLDGIEFEVNGVHVLKQKDKNDYITSPSNSFAAAFFTTFVYSILKKNERMSFFELRKILYSKASNKKYIIMKNIFKQMSNLSYLTDAYIYDIDGKIDYSACFFRCHPIQRGLDLINASNEIDLILVKNASDKYEVEEMDFVNYLNSNFVRVRSVVLCGTFSALLRRKIASCNIYYWSEYEFLKRYKNVKLHSNIECPCILFSSNNIGVKRYVSQISQKFCKDGYNCIILSDCAHAYLYGMLYVHNCRNDLQMMNQIYSPDLIIIYSESGKKNKNSVNNMDVILEIDELGNFTLKAENYIAWNGNIEAVDIIYKKLLEMLIK